LPPEEASGGAFWGQLHGLRVAPVSLAKSDREGLSATLNLASHLQREVYIFRRKDNRHGNVRREFLIQSSAGVGGALVTVIRRARIPIRWRNRLGFSLFGNGAAAEKKDFDWHPIMVRKIGYQEVEMAGFFGNKPVEIKKVA